MAPVTATSWNSGDLSPLTPQRPASGLQSTPRLHGKSCGSSAGRRVQRARGRRSRCRTGPSALMRGGWAANAHLRAETPQWTACDVCHLCAHGRARTCGLRLRRAALYPLSYVGRACAGGTTCGRRDSNPLSDSTWVTARPDSPTSARPRGVTARGRSGTSRTTTWRAQPVHHSHRALRRGRDSNPRAPVKALRRFQRRFRSQPAPPSRLTAHGGGGRGRTATGVTPNRFRDGGRRRLSAGSSLVGLAGFEPTTSASRTRRATKLRYNPTCAPGRIRTSDTRIRNPVLYPLSYRGSCATGCRVVGWVRTTDLGVISSAL